MVGAVAAGQIQPLGHDVDGDDLGAHVFRAHGAAQAHRPLSEDRHHVAAGHVDLLEAVPCRAGAAGDGRSALEGQLLGQMDQQARRHQDVVGVGAVGIHAAEGDVAVRARLLEALGANLADAATLVVVHHHPVAHLETGRGAGAQFVDDAAGLVAGDCVDGHVATVAVKVGAAHARGADLDHRLAGTRVRVRKLAYFALSVAVEHHAAHRFFSCLRGICLRPVSRCRAARQPDFSEFLFPDDGLC